jgi:hypothetical protein
MGTIHDYDVNIPKLKAHVQEVRLFNRSVPIAADRVSTGAMVKFIREQNGLRKALFQEMTTILDRWQRDNFKGKIIQSMLVSS